MVKSDNLLTKLQDLLVYLIPQLNKFPRDQKFVLGASSGLRVHGSTDCRSDGLTLKIKQKQTRG